MINTTLSCTPTLVQLAGAAALQRDREERDQTIQKFREKVELLTTGLNNIDGFHLLDPAATFYVFPNIGGVVESLGLDTAYEALPETVRHESSPSTLFQLFLLHRYRVATMDRRSFCQLDSDGHHFLRLSVATGAADLEEAVSRIAAAATDIAGFRSFLKSGVKLSL